MTERVSLEEALLWARQLLPLHYVVIKQFQPYLKKLIEVAEAVSDPYPVGVDNHEERVAWEERRDRTKADAEFIAQQKEMIGLIGGDNLAALMCGRAEVIPAEVYTAIKSLVPLFLIQGDAAQWQNPHTNISLNTSTSWAVTQTGRSAHKLRKDIELINKAFI